MTTFRNRKTGEIKKSDSPQDGTIWEWFPEGSHLLESTPSTLTEQVGGSHYKSFVIQPFEFIQKNGLGFCEGSVIKYVCRWRNKNGVEDLKKARHYLDMLIEMEEKK